MIGDHGPWSKLESSSLVTSLVLSEATLYVWRRRFGAMDATDAKRLKALEVENGRLKRIVAERDLEIEVMKEIAAKKNGDRGRSAAGG